MCWIWIWVWIWSCIWFHAESELEFESGSDFLGVVPFDVDFLESECTNHVAESTYTSDLLYEVQADEPALESVDDLVELEENCWGSKRWWRRRDTNKRFSRENKEEGSKRKRKEEEEEEKEKIQECIPE